MNLPASARITAMGGTLISVKDYDLNNAYQNPALLNRQMDNTVTLSQVNYLSNINYGYVAYGKYIKNIGTFDAGLQYVNYGKTAETDASGNVIGNFSGGDYVFNIGWATQYDPRVTYGFNLKTIYSQLAEYTSVGIAGDAAVAYHDSAENFTATALIKNIGQQLSTYTPGNSEPLPLEMQAGISKKLSKAPFRFSIIATNLQKFDISYLDPQEQAKNIDLSTGQPIIQKVSFADKLSRHFIVGVEALLSKNFILRFSYNQQRRKELSIIDQSAKTGLAWGFELRIKKINISYGSASYYLGSGMASNHFTVSMNLNEFVKKNNKQKS